MTGTSRTVNHRLPRERWARVWGLALLAVAVALGGWEGYLRLRGVVPSVASRTSVWVASRYRVRSTSTVAAGTSRMLAALDPDEWARDFGGDPAIQLSVLGGSTIRLIEHLADSPAFRGLVIADVAPFFTFDTGPLPTRLVDDRVAAYQRARTSPAQRIEAVLRTWVPSLFAFRRPEFGADNLLQAVAAGTPLPVPAVAVRPDGWAPLDFRRAGVEANSRRVLSPATFEHLQSVPPDDSTFHAQLARLASAVDRLRARGASVVLVYMPGCGGRKLMEERRYPKERYWTAVRRQVPALVIDFEAFPEAGSLPCYDGSHVDRSDADRVTAWLAAQTRAGLSSSRAVETVARRGGAGAP